MSWTMLEVEDMWGDPYWKKLGHQACWTDGKVRAAKVLRQLHSLAGIATFSPPIPLGTIREHLCIPFGGDLFSRFVTLMVDEIDLAQRELTGQAPEGYPVQELARIDLDDMWKLSGLTCVKPKRRHE